ncbi:DNA translocase FtsK [Pandoraea pnomenusa]|uniref:DNA translocase FtsK n=1 Tax=Pandoraea pnomenusa TaxID=93220 RepID=UPI002431108A|nr:DNA translocase FtsK [Pandoraea pnomenusa]
MEKFQFNGKAVIQHLNTRKKGPDDEQELVLDLKLRAVTDYAVMGAFDEGLAAFVFFSNGAVRNKALGPITFTHELSDYRLEMDGSVFTAVRIKKFAIEPKDGFKVALTMLATFKPSPDEVARIAEFLQDDIDVLLSPQNGELGFGDSFSAGDAGFDELYPEAVRLVRAEGKASISMIQRHLRIGYNRAARLLEMLEQGSFVSAAKADGTRDILGREEAHA